MLVCVFRGLSSEMQVCRDMYIHMCAAKFIAHWNAHSILTENVSRRE